MIDDHHVENIILKALKETSLNTFSFVSNPEKKYLKFCKDMNFVREDSMIGALEENILNYARRNYEISIKNNYYADDLSLRPDFIAYGMIKGIFSDEEISKLRFDHDKDPKKYMKLYGDKDLPKKILKKLLM